MIEFRVRLAQHRPFREKIVHESNYRIKPLRDLVTNERDKLFLTVSG